MNKNKRNTKLKSQSQVYSLNRLSDPDVETASSLTAGGNKSYLEDDINDKNPWV